MDVRIVSSTPRGDAVLEDVTIEGAGDPVAAFLVRPSRRDARGPGVLWAHWFDPEAPDGDRSQYVEEALELAGSGVTSVLPQGRFPWTVAPTGAAPDVAAVEEEVRRTLLAIGSLVEDPAVDPERLAMVGHDFGGMAAIVAATAGPTLRGLVVVAVTPRWADWFLPFWPITDDRIEYLRTLRPMDPIERLGNVRCERVLLQSARHDFFIAPMATIELHRAAPDGARLEWYESDHAMREPEVRTDRRAFLGEVLGLPDA